VMGRGRNYRAFNARRLLESVRPDLRAEWIALASESAERTRRLGAIAVLRQMDATGHEDLLRRLAADSDLEIRSDALTALNDRLRVLRGTSAGSQILLASTKENWIRSVTFAGDLLLVAFRRGDMRAFDVQTLQALWTTRLTPGLGDQVLVAGDQFILASQEGDLLSLGRRGHVIWSKEAADDENIEIRRLIHRGDDIFVVYTLSLEQIDAKTGEAISKIPAVDFIRDADSSQAAVFFVDGRGLRAVDSFAGAEPAFSRTLGVSVSQDLVCVTSVSPENRVVCMEPQSLSPRWTGSIGSNGTWGHGIAPIQYDSRVFVTTDNTFSAFNASDGALLWTTFGGQETHGVTMPTEYGLLTQNYHYQLELRDPDTGEVRRVWPKIHGVARMAVQQQFAAVADLDDVLWLVDLSDSSPAR